MLQFNELRIDSNKHLIIDATVTVSDASVYIDKLSVGFGSMVNTVNLLDNTILSVLDSSTYSLSPAVNPRNIRFDLDLTSDALHTLVGVPNPEKMLAYIRAEITGNAAWISSLSCSDTTVFEGYVYDKCLLTSKVFDYLKQTDNPCNVLDDMTHYIVQSQGLQLAVESGNFNIANMYWNKFFGMPTIGSSLTFNTGCGCH